MPTLDDLNAHEYVTVLSIEQSEKSDWALRIIAVEQRSGDPLSTMDLAEDSEPVRKLLEGARPIGTTPDCATYEICFPEYVIYTVLDESYSGAGGDVPSDRVGGPFAFSCRRSWLIDHVTRTTYASDTWPGPLTHYQLLTSDHIVDVVTHTEPIVRRIATEC